MSTVDPNQFNAGLSAGTTAGAAVTPNDGADLPGGAIRWFMVTAAGPVTVASRDGQSTYTLPACQPGIQYACLTSRILATGTTATGIWAGV